MPDMLLTVHHPEGLHARPAAQLAKTAQQFQATITITLGRWSANAKSILEILTLGVNSGSEIHIQAQGEDAPQALQAIQNLVKSNFGDKPAALAPLQTAPPLSAIPASPGIAIAPAYLHLPAAPNFAPRHNVDAAQEQERAASALTVARAQLLELQQPAEQKAGTHEAAIFEAHALILEDPSLLQNCLSAIATQSLCAEAAFQQTGEALAQRLEQVPDELIRQRAADIRDVTRRVVRILSGATDAPLAGLASPAILFAEDLSPSDTIQLDKSLVLGIYVAKGSRTSHAAILARSLGIPAAVGGGFDLSALQNGAMTILNGDTGEIILNPTPEILAQYQNQHSAQQQTQKQNASAAQQTAQTLDGIRVEIAANIGGLSDAQEAPGYGAEGVGLLRTEFLFLERAALPAEEEQFQTYRAILEALAPHPVILRTLDIGGDKKLPYFSLPQEDNPFLGLRAARLCFEHPQLWIPQLRAALRAGYGHNLRIMLPMIANLGEIRRAKQTIAQAQAALVAEGFQVAEHLQIGIMVEIPSAALMAETLTQEVDFFSIGTNDLTQYTFAADRMNPAVAEIANPFDPALLRLIQLTVNGAKAGGKWAGMCGEFAGEPLAIPLLVGLGLDELSMNPRQIPAAKALIRKVSAAQCRDLAKQALQAHSAQQVEALCRDFQAKL